MPKFLTDPAAQKFIDQIGQPFKNVPHLPKDIVDFLVVITPWLALIGGVSSILGAISTASSGSALNRMGAIVGVHTGFSGYMLVTAIFALIIAALLLMAFSLLKKKAKTGWTYLFWTNVVGIIQSIVYLILWQSGIVSMILGAIIGFYILFEIRPQYKN